MTPLVCALKRGPGTEPEPETGTVGTVFVGTESSDSVKRHLRGRHLSVLNLKFDFISDGGCTREEQIALSLKRHLFPHGGREPKAFWICFSRVHPPSEIKSNFKFKTLKRHLPKRHLTLSEKRNRNRWNRFSVKTLLRYRETLSLEEPSEPKTGTARTVPCTNRNRTVATLGLQKGPAERGHVANFKNRQKVSKIFLTHFDSFGAGQKKKCVCSSMARHYPGVRVQTSGCWSQ